MAPDLVLPQLRQEVATFRTLILLSLVVTALGGCERPKPVPTVSVEITPNGYRTVEDAKIDGVEAGPSLLDAAVGAQIVTAELTAGTHVLTGRFDGVPSAVRFDVVVEKGVSEDYIMIEGKPPKVLGQ